jgi:hypothetical protein
MLGLVARNPSALAHKQFNCRNRQATGFSTGITAQNLQLPVIVPSAEARTVEIVDAAEETQALLPRSNLGSAYADAAPAVAESLAPEALQQETAHAGMARHNSILDRINEAVSNTDRESNTDRACWPL